MKSRNFSYIPEIDHLRGLAALLVILFHSLHFISYDLIFNQQWDFENWPYARNLLDSLLIEGHTGVSLFFVLSGFIFTAGSYGRSLNYVGFYKNRLLRTYPLFLFVLFVGIYAYPASFSWGSFLQTVFFMANANNAIDAGPFTFVFWSIAVEWQFYLLFPFLLAFLVRTGPSRLLGIIAALILMRFFAWGQGADTRNIGYWSIVGRLDQFIIGMLLAVGYLKYFQKSMRFDMLAVVGSLLILGALFFFNRNGGPMVASHIWIFWPTLEGICWSVFIMGYLSAARWLPAVIAEPFRLLGLISYSTYLLHFLVVDLVVRHGLVWEPTQGALTNAFVTAFVVVLPVVLMLATLTYHFIEKPFLTLRLKYVQREGKAES